MPLDTKAKWTFIKTERERDVFIFSRFWNRTVTFNGGKFVLFWFFFTKFTQKQTTTQIINGYTINVVVTLVILMITKKKHPHTNTFTSILESACKMHELNKTYIKTCHLKRNSIFYKFANLFIGFEEVRFRWILFSFFCYRKTDSATNICTNKFHIHKSIIHNVNV